MSAKLVPGLYEQLVTVPLARQLHATPSELVLREELDASDADVLLARHVYTQVRHALRLVAGGADGDAALTRQVALVNGIMTQLGRESGQEVTEVVADAHEVLLALLERPSHPGPPRAPSRPEVPLSASALLVNGSTQPRIGTELRRELESADAVDLLCAFVKWQGFRVLETELRALRERGCRLRVLTTTYMGATDRRALDALVALGAEVRVSYETRSTRLHAKAWLFHRNTGFSTAYIGSSNLSRSALLDGLEWNVRVAAAEQPHVVDTFRATFEAYWEDTSFEPYEPARDAARFDSAIAAERGEAADELTLVGLEVRPFEHQRAMLERLEAERMLHGRWKNLVVAATGTGKTVLAALDYARLRKQQRVDSVLFVAHRDTILKQSRHTFRSVLRDGTFGELYVGGEQPKVWRHVFASVQSLAQVDLAQLSPTHFDMVVVDEFHHAMADTYVRLLEHLSPRVLVGLTATPERMDGQDVKQWFDGRIAVELRLWEALDRGLLAPFQYFGVHDDVSLSHLEWKRGGYELGALSGVYTGNDARAQKVIEEVRRRVGDVGQMRALGFCVSIEHAEYMARRFREHGIPAESVSSRTTQDVRADALRALRERRVNALFAVDLFNEGLDIPEVDTVLFLRPTESATVFLQQLGRGLRHSGDKACLTVLDFIGQQHSRFRFDTRLRALTGTSRRELERQVEHGFPYLPAGCHLELDSVATTLVLENVRQGLNIGWRGLVTELRSLGDVGLSQFLEETGIELEDLYRSKRGWAALRREAGLEAELAGPEDAKLAGAIGRLLHLDDLERLEAYRALLDRPEPPRTDGVSPRELRLHWMLHFSLWGANESPERLGEGLRKLWAEPARRREFLEVLALLSERLERVTPALDAAGRVPLRVHARYSRDEALAAFGVDKPASVRQGVKWVEAEQADLLFVTLRKTERHYSPTTRYRDYAISSRLFHWESQNMTSEGSETGQRYIDHRARGSSVQLFIRETKEGLLGASPYVYAGPAHYMKHEGSRPMAIVWKLEHELPVELLERAKVVAG
jgi:superfamily II DNA or RNA helicase/HKD family nuclease